MPEGFTVTPQSASLTAPPEGEPDCHGPLGLAMTEEGWGSERKVREFFLKRGNKLVYWVDFVEDWQNIGVFG